MANDISVGSVACGGYSAEDIIRAAFRAGVEWERSRREVPDQEVFRRFIRPAETESGVLLCKCSGEQEVVWKTETIVMTRCVACGVWTEYAIGG